MNERTAMDETKMMEFVDRAVGDVGAVLGGAMVVIGDKLGLYRAMAGAGSLTPAELADRTGTAERYVREWLSAQAARTMCRTTVTAGSRCPTSTRCRSPTRPAPRVIGAFEIAVGSVYATDTIAERFRTGDGFAWGARRPCPWRLRTVLPARLPQPSRRHMDPGLDGVEAKLTAGRGSPTSGAATAHRRCCSPRPIRRRRSSASTLMPARSTPPASAPPTPDSPTGCASRSPRPRRSPGRTTWCASSTACTTWVTRPARAPTSATASPPTGRSCSSSRSPTTSSRGNLNPVGAAYYGFSTLLCTPSSLSQDVGTALGAQAGEARLRDIVTSSGFTTLRRVAETPFNIVLEAKT